MYTDEFIKEYYKTHSRQEVADLLGIRYNSVGHILKRCGAYDEKKKRRTKIVNEDFFIKDSEDLDYILGYIVGDGCIRSKRTGQREINIWSKDTQILTDISKVITYTGSLKSGINFRSDKVASILESKGVISNKSILGGKVDIKYPSHYLRGLFDSDGCITHQHRKDVLRLYFFGHEDTMSQVKDILSSLGINKEIRYRKDNICEIGIFKSDEIVLVRDFIYKDAKLYLERKFNKFMVKI